MGSFSLEPGPLLPDLPVFFGSGLSVSSESLDFLSASGADFFWWFGSELEVLSALLSDSLESPLNKKMPPMTRTTTTTAAIPVQNHHC